MIVVKTFRSMALPRSFDPSDAAASLKRTGKYTLQDNVIGSRIKEFSDVHFPTKSLFGQEFIAKNSFNREDVRQVLDSILDKPHFGLIKIYSQILPSDYAFRLHDGSSAETFCVLVFLWSPGSKVCFYDGTISHSTKNDYDQEVSATWGVLATPKLRVNQEGVSKDIISLERGGLVLSDSRLQFSIIQGYAIVVGFAIQAEVAEWGMMDLHYSDALQAKINEWESGGLGIRYTWLKSPE